MNNLLSLTRINEKNFTVFSNYFIGHIKVRIFGEKMVLNMVKLSLTYIN